MKKIFNPDAHKWVPALSVFLIAYWIVTTVSSIPALFLFWKFLHPDFLGYDYNAGDLTAVRALFIDFLLTSRTTLLIGIPLALIAIVSAVGLHKRLNAARYTTVGTLAIAVALPYLVCIKGFLLVSTMIQENGGQELTAGIWVAIAGVLLGLLAYTALALYVMITLMSASVRGYFRVDPGTAT
jgi:hypothetical protein